MYLPALVTRSTMQPRDAENISSSCPIHLTTRNKGETREPALRKSEGTSRVDRGLALNLRCHCCTPPQPMRIPNYTSAFIWRNKFRGWEEIFHLRAQRYFHWPTKLSISRMKAELRLWKFGGILFPLRSLSYRTYVYLYYEILPHLKHIRARTRLLCYGWLTLSPVLTATGIKM